MSIHSDTVAMRRALRLAERAKGRTAPNPAVGAVIIQDGTVVGEGFHRGPGRPHAEVVALEEAAERARGATMYLTLEPCTHYGRTPPCAPRLIASGIARVVVGTSDPNPIERGAGIRALRDAGIEVVEGVLHDEARALIAGFARLVTTGLPLVTLKLASSLDGKVAAADGSSRWVTGPGARRDVHRMRAASGAVLVGIGTVLADDPSLTCRLRGFAGTQPIRVILDSLGRTPLGSAVLNGKAPTLIATTDKAPEEFGDHVRERGAEAIVFGWRDGRIDAVAVLAEIGRRGITDVLVEGGPTVAADLLDRGLVDRFVFYLAPKLLGGMGIGSIGALEVPGIADAPELTITNVRRIGADVRIEAKPRV